MLDLFYLYFFFFHFIEYFSILLRVYLALNLENKMIHNSNSIDSIDFPDWSAILISSIDLGGDHKYWLNQVINWLQSIFNSEPVDLPLTEAHIPYFLNVTVEDVIKKILYFNSPLRENEIDEFSNFFAELISLMKNLASFENLLDIYPSIFDSKLPLYQHPGSSKIYDRVVQQFKQIETDFQDRIFSLPEIKYASFFVQIYSNLSKKTTIEEETFNNIIDIYNSRLGEIQLDNKSNCSKEMKLFDSLLKLTQKHFNEDQFSKIYKNIKFFLKQQLGYYQKFAAHCLSQLSQYPKYANILANKNKNKSFFHLIQKYNMNKNSLLELLPYIQFLMNQKNDLQLKNLFLLWDFLCKQYSSILEDSDVFIALIVMLLSNFDGESILNFISTIQSFLHPLYFKIASKLVIAINDNQTDIACNICNILVNLSPINTMAKDSIKTIINPEMNYEVLKSIFESLIIMIADPNLVDFSCELMQNIIQKASNPNFIITDKNFEKIIDYLNKYRSKILNLLAYIYISCKKAPTNSNIKKIIQTIDKNTYIFLIKLIQHFINVDLDDFLDDFTQSEPRVAPYELVELLQIYIINNKRFPFKRIIEKNNLNNIPEYWKNLENYLYNIQRVELFRSDLRDLPYFDYIYEIYKSTKDQIIEKMSFGFLIFILFNTDFDCSSKYIYSKFKNLKIDNINNVNEETKDKHANFIIRYIKLVKCYLNVAELYYDPEDCDYPRHFYSKKYLKIHFLYGDDKFSLHIKSTNTMYNLKMRLAQKLQLNENTIVIRQLIFFENNTLLSQCGIQPSVIYDIEGSPNFLDKYPNPPSLILFNQGLALDLFQHFDYPNLFVNQLIWSFLKIMPSISLNQIIMNINSESVLIFLKTESSKFKILYLIQLLVKTCGIGNIFDNIDVFKEIFSHFNDNFFRIDIIKLMNKLTEYIIFPNSVSISLIKAFNDEYINSRKDKEEILDIIINILIKISSKNKSDDFSNNIIHEIFDGANHINECHWDLLLELAEHIDKQDEIFEFAFEKVKTDLNHSSFFLKLVSRFYNDPTDLFHFFLNSFQYKNYDVKITQEILEIMNKLLKNQSYNEKLLNINIPLSLLLDMAVGNNFKYLQKPVLKIVLKYLKNKKLSYSLIRKEFDKYLSLKINKYNYTNSNLMREFPYIGLKNLGSTCYINSIFQQLFHLLPIRYLIMTATIKDDDDLILIQDLFKKMAFSQRPYCNTKSFVNSWHWDKIKINPRMQQDAMEFFLALIDSLPLNINEMFKGVISNMLDGIEENFHDTKDEFFYNLSVLVKGQRNMDSSLHQFIQDEVVSGYECEAFENTISVKKYSRIKRLPPILVIQLKRFEYDFKTNERYKINDNFEFSEQLDISQLCDSTLLNSKDQYLYHLSGIVIHIGTALSGHYFSLIKKGNSWYDFNDINISKLTDDEVKDLAFGKREGYSAYILFYTKNQYSAIIDNKQMNFTTEYEMEKIIDNDKKYFTVQALFNEPVLNFVNKITDPLLKINFYVKILCHSTYSSYAKLFFENFTSCFPDKSIGNINEELIDELINLNYEICLNFIYCSNGDLLKNQQKIISYCVDNINEEISIKFIECWICSINSYLKYFKKLPNMLKIINKFISKHLQYAIKINLLSKLLDIINNIYNEDREDQYFENIDLSYLLNSIQYLLSSDIERDITILQKHFSKIQKSKIHIQAYQELLLLCILIYHFDAKNLTFSNEFETGSKINAFLKESIENNDRRKSQRIIKNALNSGLISHLALLKHLFNEVKKNTTSKFSMNLLNMYTQLLFEYLFNKNIFVGNTCKDIFDTFLSDLDLKIGKDNSPYLLISKEIINLFDEMIAHMKDLKLSNKSENSNNRNHVEFNHFNFNDIVLIDYSNEIQMDSFSQLILNILTAFKQQSFNNSDITDYFFNEKVFTNTLFLLSNFQTYNISDNVFLQFLEKIDYFPDNTIKIHLKEFINIICKHYKKRKNDSILSKFFDIIQKEEFLQYNSYELITNSDLPALVKEKSFLEFLVKFINEHQSLNCFEQLLSKSTKLIHRIVKADNNNNAIEYLVELFMNDDGSPSMRLLDSKSFILLCNFLINEIFEKRNLGKNIELIKNFMKLKIDNLKIHSTSIVNQWVKKINTESVISLWNRPSLYRETLKNFIIWLSHFSSDLDKHISVLVDAMLDRNIYTFSLAFEYYFDKQNKEKMLKIYEHITKIEHNKIIINENNKNNFYDCISNKISGLKHIEEDYFLMDIFQKIIMKCQHSTQEFSLINTISMKIDDNTRLKLLFNIEKQYLEDKDTSRLKIFSMIAKLPNDEYKEKGLITKEMIKSVSIDLYHELEKNDKIDLFR